NVLDAVADTAGTVDVEPDLVGDVAADAGPEVPGRCLEVADTRSDFRGTTTNVDIVDGHVVRIACAGCGASGGAERSTRRLNRILDSRLGRVRIDARLGVDRVAERERLSCGKERVVERNVRQGSEVTRRRNDR